MKRNANYFRMFAAYGLFVLAGALLVGCGQHKFLYLKTDSENRILHAQKSGIDVSFEISTNCLVDNKLVITNRSSSPVTVSPENILIEIPEKKLKTTAVKDYAKFLDRRSARLQSLCGAGEYPYVCSEEIRSFYQSKKNRGFIFGDIKPGKSADGNVAFGMPLIVNNSKWNSVEKAQEAKVSFKFIVNQKPVIITFPLLVTCDDVDNVPYSVLKNLR